MDYAVKISHLTKQFKRTRSRPRRVTDAEFGSRPY